jgi:hypothetical protein
LLCHPPPTHCAARPGAMSQRRVRSRRARRPGPARSATAAPPLCFHLHQRLRCTHRYLGAKAPALLWLMRTAHDAAEVHGGLSLLRHAMACPNVWEAAGPAILAPIARRDSSRALPARNDNEAIAIRASSRPAAVRNDTRRDRLATTTRSTLLIAPTVYRTYVLTSRVRFARNAAHAHRSQVRLGARVDIARRH